MKLAQNDRASLRSALNSASDLSNRFVLDETRRVSLSELATGSILYGRGDELSGRSVFLTTRDQLTTAAALIELDGVARRIVISPPDLPFEHIAHVIDTAEVDAIVSDCPPLSSHGSRPMYFSSCAREFEPSRQNGSALVQTEWVMLTSGTTGVPKLVGHTFAALTGAIDTSTPPAGSMVWSTFYDIRRYGGMQIFLRAMLTGSTLVLSSNREATSDFLIRAGENGVTHISGTPSQWRRALMTSSASSMSPEYVRLSGEVADQGILNSIRATYPQARIVHAFASTEAGVAFEVKDGLSGFPESLLTQAPGVDLKIEDGSLRIRSRRTAGRYLGDRAPVLKDADGFVDTGDLVELRDGRFYFIGRRDGIINVGGLKVYPEEIEAVINRHPQVRMSLVRGRKSSVTGSIVVADVVLHATPSTSSYNLKSIQEDILLLCREGLASYKVPAMINVVPELAVAASGKVVRRSA
jgi:acyl-coenzyme A synthetase/AMP-(fatty) acid ligase